MNDIGIPVDEILKTYRGVNNFWLDSDENEEKINFIQPSLYYETESLPSCLKGEGHFNVLNLNTQSINAKFDALEIANQQDIFFHDICLQEIWLKEDANLSIFHIACYQCISKWKACSKHEDLMIYLHKNLFSTKISADNDSPIWESHFILVKDIEFNKEIILGNHHLTITVEKKIKRRTKPNIIAFEQVLSGYCYNNGFQHKSTTRQ